MELMLMLFLGVLGASIGSFLNVVCIRGDMSWTKGRSRCDSCGYQLSWYDNIPLVSFICLGGKCRKCKKKIPIQHFVSEVMGFIVFASLGINSYIVTDPMLLVPLLIVVALFCYSAISDSHTMTVPILPQLLSMIVMTVYMLLNAILYGTFTYWWIYLLIIVAWIGFDVICTKYNLDNLPFIGMGDLDLLLMFAFVVPVVNQWSTATPNMDMVFNMLIELNYYILCSCLVAMVTIIPQILMKKRKLRQPFAYAPSMYVGVAIYLLNNYLRINSLVPWY